MRRNSVASLASLLEPKTFAFARPTCPLPQWDSQLSAFVVGLHPLPGQMHHNPNSKPYGIVSNHGKDTNSDATKTIDVLQIYLVCLQTLRLLHSGVPHTDQIPLRSIRWLQPLCDHAFCLNKQTKHCPKEDEIDPSQNAGLDASMEIVTQKMNAKKVQNTRYRRDTSVFKKASLLSSTLLLQMEPSECSEENRWRHLWHDCLKVKGFGVWDFAQLTKEEHDDKTWQGIAKYWNKMWQRKIQDKMSIKKSMTLAIWC